MGHKVYLRATLIYAEGKALLLYKISCSVQSFSYVEAMSTLLSCVVFVSILFAVIFAKNNEADKISMSDLLTRFEMMESRYQTNIQQLNDKVDSSALEIAKLKSEIAELSSLQRVRNA